MMSHRQRRSVENPEKSLFCSVEIGCLPEVCKAPRQLEDKTWEQWLEGLQGPLLMTLQEQKASTDRIINRREYFWVEEDKKIKKNKVGELVEASLERIKASTLPGARNRKMSCPSHCVHAALLARWSTSQIPSKHNGLWSERGISTFSAVLLQPCVPSWTAQWGPDSSKFTLWKMLYGWEPLSHHTADFLSSATGNLSVSLSKPVIICFEDSDLRYSTLYKI